MSPQIAYEYDKGKGNAIPSEWTEIMALNILHENGNVFLLMMTSVKFAGKDLIAEFLYNIFLDG